MSICSNGRMMGNSSALQGKKQKIIKPLDLKKWYEILRSNAQQNLESIRPELLHDYVVDYTLTAL